MGEICVFIFTKASFKLHPNQLRGYLRY